ncbi:hypothetical protein B0H34DRAFT_686396 [Crassisporium funariophilum]|nr:hypothetical protein B0H34DRAFT_686396 [Crassisporium funariophilum]
MPQPTPEAEAFIARIEALAGGAGVSLDQAIQPSLDDEAELRTLFATDRGNTRLSNPHVGLVDVFEGPDAIRTTRARVVDGSTDLTAKYVMPLSEVNRRKEGAPSMVADLEEFKKNWSVFTEGSLSQLLDWNNVVAAGGAVLACLTPLKDTSKVSKRAIRKFYHSAAYPASDVDLFLYGMTPEQAEAKIVAIYEAVRDSVPWDVTCVRTKHTVSILSQYPYRSVQIVLRLYQTPAEILAGFDIDAPCCAYDGNRVWANPRAIVATMRQCNTVDMTRRSPSYEVRLAKYSGRAFEVFVPTLRREDIDPTIYERSIARMEGLARLIVLEKLTDTDTRYAFLDSRRTLRGRPNPLKRYNRKKDKFKGDLKADLVVEGMMNDYDVTSLHIPYGPGWEARRIEKLIYQTDLGMNSTFNPKNKGRRLHRHPAFFGTMEECLQDCCEACPDPIDEDERKLQATEDEMYIRGRIKFIEQDPGRQSISGSFNPIDDGEWSEHAYIKPTQKLFTAIAAHDRESVQRLLKGGEIDVNHRDHVGRTTLHVAILSKALEIACDLIDAGARITARLVDGRTPLHLASQYDEVTVIQKLFEKNALNVAEEELKNPKATDDGEAKITVDTKVPTERPSSEDDWSSHDDDDVEMVDADDADDADDSEMKDGERDSDNEHKEDEGKNNDDENEDHDCEGGSETHSQPERTASPAGPSGDIPDEDEDELDIIDVDLPDWDFGFTALNYAVLFASLPVIDELIKCGADVKLSSKLKSNDSKSIHPLTLTILRQNENEASVVAARLITAGATSTIANEQMWTIFHSIVASGKAKVLATILRCDPNAPSMINFPSLRYQEVVFPVVTAISNRNYAVLAVLLAHDVKLELDESDITRAQVASPSTNRIALSPGMGSYVDLAFQPIETALHCRDDVIQLLLTFGAPFNLSLKRGLHGYCDHNERKTIIDWVNFAIHNLSQQVAKLSIAPPKTKVEKAPKSPWKLYVKQYKEALTAIEETEIKQSYEEAETIKEENIQLLKDTSAYLEEVKRLLVARGAKPWKEVYPNVESKASVTDTDQAIIDEEDSTESPQSKASETSYSMITKSYNRQPVPQHLTSSYDELYKACYAGDDRKVQLLCLPPEGAKKPPLNIFVRMSLENDNNYDPDGFTPLYAAIVARKWSTAKLIMAIATSQYHPEENEDKKKFSTSDIKLVADDDNDTDDGSEDTASDATMEQREVKFVDIATRPSTVRSHIRPEKLLEILFRHPGGKPSRSTPLTKTVIDGDYEAFVQVANLHKSLAPPLDLGEDLLHTILIHDRADILDEYIRRTGYGIDIHVAHKDGGNHEVVLAVNDTKRIYLGLNVHGKKRADLATKNDPDAIEKGDAEPPLLWRAAQVSAKNIINYLAGEQPLAAYKQYTTSHSDERAMWFRRVRDFEDKLPVWLGWTISDIGESPLTASIISNDLDIIKLLVARSSPLMASAFEQKIKFVGANPLLFAIHKSCNTAVIDYLLNKKVSPADHDLVRGWNIYHYICDSNNGDLLEYFLGKLPRDVNEALLAQQSKGRSNTPLHIAVHSGAKRLVKQILDFSRATVLTRDVDGSTVLHVSVKCSYPEITEMLLATVDPEDLEIENGVGNTILEIASLPELSRRIEHHINVTHKTPSDISPNYVEEQGRYDDEIVEALKEEMPRLHSIIGELLPEERKKRRTKLIWELNTFATMVDGRLKDANAKHEEKLLKLKEKNAKEIQNPIEEANIDLTLSVVQKALKSGPINRQLVHIADVQRSVGADLEKVRRRTKQSQLQSKEDNGLDEHVDNKDKRKMRQSFVFNHINTKPDGYGGLGSSEDDDDDDE